MSFRKFFGNAAKQALLEAYPLSIKAINDEIAEVSKLKARLDESYLLILNIVGSVGDIQRAEVGSDEEAHLSNCVIGDAKKLLENMEKFSYVLYKEQYDKAYNRLDSSRKKNELSEQQYEQLSTSLQKSVWFDVKEDAETVESKATKRSITTPAEFYDIFKNIVDHTAKKLNVLAKYYQQKSPHEYFHNLSESLTDQASLLFKVINADAKQQISSPRKTLSNG